MNYVDIIGASLLVFVFIIMTCLIEKKKAKISAWFVFATLGVAYLFVVGFVFIAEQRLIIDVLVR